MKQKHNFYFTFGNNAKFPYQNGWIIIQAENESQARAIFQILFPNPTDPTTLNCSFVYTEEEFRKTKMYQNQNNFGHNSYGTYTITFQPATKGTV